MCLTPHLKCHWAQPSRLALFGKNPQNAPHEDTARFTHQTSAGEQELWSSVEIKFGENSMSGAMQREVLRC